MSKELRMTSAMAAAILALPGCDDPPPQTWEAAQGDTAVCVNQEGERVEDDRCDDRSYRGSGASSAFLWYFIGRGSAIPYYGDSIRDRRFRNAGSFTPRAGAQYALAPASTRVTRGGFGSSGRRYGVSGS